MKTSKKKTCRTDRANEVNKMFIIWLCLLFYKKNELFDALKGDQELEVRTATYGPEIVQSQHEKSVIHITIHDEYRYKIGNAQDFRLSVIKTNWSKQRSRSYFIKNNCLPLLIQNSH